MTEEHSQDDLIYHSTVYDEIVIYTEPIGAPRPRAVVRGGFTRMYNPSKYTHWKSEFAFNLKRQWKKPTISTGYVTLKIKAVFKRPKNLMRKKDFKGRLPHVKKPDIDNVSKAILDAMVQAKIIIDDTIIQGLHIQKFVASLPEHKQPERSCIIIEIRHHEVLQ